jgi:hypothetical protein
MSYLIVLVASFIYFLQVHPINNTESFPFKSGMIKYEFEGRMTGTELIYFDNYGDLYCSIKTLSQTNDGNSSKISTLCIRCYDSTIICDLNDQNGLMKLIRATESDNKNKIISEKMLEYMGYNKIGTKRVSGILCNSYSGESGNMCVWNNIILKLEIVIMSIHVNMEAVDVRMGIDVPSSTFELPENYKLIK